MSHLLRKAWLELNLLLLSRSRWLCVLRASCRARESVCLRVLVAVNNTVGFLLDTEQGTIWWLWGDGGEADSAAQIWSYPSTSVVGPTLFSIPLEEVFFFFIQTYITSSIYAFTSRPVLHVLILPRSARDGRRTRLAGSAFFVAVAAVSLAQIRHGTGRGTYLALILAWVSPFLALLWFVLCESSSGEVTPDVDWQVDRLNAHHSTSVFHDHPPNHHVHPLPMDVRRPRSPAWHLGDHGRHQAGCVCFRARD